jgi:exodeoxyribonuclease VII small subunit
MRRVAERYRAWRTRFKFTRQNRPPLRQRFCIQLSAELSLPKFEDCLQQLEKIVEQLERGDLPLEQSLKLFEDGIRLSNSCRQELESAEGKVELLVKQSGKLQAEPFMEIEEEKTAK